MQQEAYTDEWLVKYFGNRAAAAMYCVDVEFGRICPQASALVKERMTIGDWRYEWQRQHTAELLSFHAPLADIERFTTVSPETVTEWLLHDDWFRGSVLREIATRKCEDEYPVTMPDIYVELRERYAKRFGVSSDPKRMYYEPRSIAPYGVKGRFKTGLRWLRILKRLWWSLPAVESDKSCGSGAPTT